MSRVWTSTREISGFGGGYEAECRAMVIRGLEWLDANPDADPQFHGYQGIYGIIEEDNEDARLLLQDMLGEDGGQTGAMVQATVGHVMAVRRHGWTWAEYQAYLDEAGRKEKE